MVPNPIYVRPASNSVIKILANMLIGSFIKLASYSINLHLSFDILPGHLTLLLYTMAPKAKPILNTSSEGVKTFFVESALCNEKKMDGF